MAQIKTLAGSLGSIATDINTIATSIVPSLPLGEQEIPSEVADAVVNLQASVANLATKVQGAPVEVVAS